MGSDIDEPRYVYDVLMGKGAGAFDSQPTSKRAAAIRQYAAVRARGTDPVVKIAQEGVSNGKRTQPTASGREAVPGGTGQVREDRVQDGDGRNGSAGQAGQEVRQTGNQSQAAAVVVKKKRRVVTPAAETEARQATPCVPRGVASRNEHETSAKSQKGASQQKDAPVAGSTGQTGPGKQKESVAGRSEQADRGVTAVEVIADLKNFLHKDDYAELKAYSSKQASARAISGGNPGAGSSSGVVEGAKAERPQLSDQSSGSRDAEKVTDVEAKPVTPFVPRGVASTDGQKTQAETTPDTRGDGEGSPVSGQRAGERTRESRTAQSGSQAVSKSVFKVF